MAAAFAVLDYEEKLQLNDKTRLNAYKSFVAPLGATALTTATITPGLDGSSQDVFSATVQDRYLDWVFTTWNFDIVTGVNDKVDFDQSGEKVATLDQGTYTLAQLLTELAQSLNAVVGISGTFSCTSDEDDKITITNSTTSFTLLPYGDNKDAGLLQHIGFASRVENKYQGAEVIGKPVEYSMKRVAVAVGNGSQSSTIHKYVKLYSVAGDALYSTDTNLLTYESDIMKWVPDGRATFLNVHREAQNQILDWLDRNGYTNVYQEPYDKFDIIDLEEVDEWSTFLALSIIMWSISNKTDDVFLQKYREYLKLAAEARDRAVIRLDIDEDGQADLGEQVDIAFGTVVTR